MATSFFEKLTGASNEEIEPTIRAEETPVKSRRGRPPKAKTAETEEEKDMKKDSLVMPKVKHGPTAQPVKEIKPEIEEKDWLEEAEGEEGQLTIDVYQTETDIVIKSTIAGVNPEDIDVSITNDMVTIRGKRVKDEEIAAENYYYQELYWGGFSRSVILPVEIDADKAKAAIKNGILSISLPKSEKTKTKKIKVLSNG